VTKVSAQTLRGNFLFEKTSPGRSARLRDGQVAALGNISSFVRLYPSEGATK